MWFYRLDYLKGVKGFTKTRSMRDDHFDPVREWWKKKVALTDEKGKDKARFFTPDELAALNYDFDKCCPFPHEDKEILPPAELIADYQSKRTAFNAKIDDLLARIEAKLK